MRAAKDKERVQCPVSNDKITPYQCWDSKLPDGTSVTYGIIPLGHKHRELMNFFGNYVEKPCD